MGERSWIKKRYKLGYSRNGIIKNGHLGALAIAMYTFI